MLAAAAIGATACGDDAPEGILVFEPAPEELEGVWTGTEEISGGGGTVVGSGDGFAFPVSLVLREDRSFVLRSFGFPVEGNGEAGGPCVGIWVVDGRRLEFFPNGDCRALPLSRYTIGRTFPDGLTLRSETGVRAVTGGTSTARIRVVIRVERD